MRGGEGRGLEGRGGEGGWWGCIRVKLRTRRWDKM